MIKEDGRIDESVLGINYIRNSTRGDIDWYASTDVLNTVLNTKRGDPFRCIKDRSGDV